METVYKKSERVFKQDILFSQGIPFYADETIEDLQRDQLRLIQKKGGFRFGSDSVLLAAYAASFYAGASKRRLLAADLGAGCGAVTILLAARLPAAKLVGLEKDAASYFALQRNVFLNRLQERVYPVQIDLRQLVEKGWPFPDLPQAACDLVVGNPPYLRPDQSLLTDQPSAARAELDLPLAVFLKAAARLLKQKGRLVLVQRPHRLADVLQGLPEAGFAARSLRFIHALPERAPHAFLLSAQRAGKAGGLQVAAPLFLADRPGSPSQELTSYYGNAAGLSQDLLEQDLVREGS